MMDIMANLAVISWDISGYISSSISILSALCATALLAFWLLDSGTRLPWVGRQVGIGIAALAALIVIAAEVGRILGALDASRSSLTLATLSSWTTCAVWVGVMIVLSHITARIPHPYYAVLHLIGAALFLVGVVALESGVVQIVFDSGALLAGLLLVGAAVVIPIGSMVMALVCIWKVFRAQRTL